MNERIKELWDKAATASAAYPSGQNNSWETQVNFLEKFAEMIVRECANHCDLLLDHKISSEWSRGTHDCSRAIKKHFGVTE